MMKRVTNAYVLKFVGGDGAARECFYCRTIKGGGMICVYGNCPNAPGGGGEDYIFICPECAVQGCRESEQQWADIFGRHST